MLYFFHIHFKYLHNFIYNSSFLIHNMTKQTSQLILTYKTNQTISLLFSIRCLSLTNTVFNGFGMCHLQVIAC